MAVGQSTFLPQLTTAGANTCSGRRLLWALVAVFALRRLIAGVPVFMPPGADVFPFIYDGHRALTNPDAIYAESAALIARGFVFITLYPPPQLLIAVVYALAPGSSGAYLWVATNALAALAALVLLLRLIKKIHPAATPIFWLVTVCFTPLFEDIRLGQRGGLLMLLSVGAMSLIFARPATAGVLAGLATSLKFYPGAMVLAVDPRKTWTFIASLIATAGITLGVSFIPFGSPFRYLFDVLLPSLGWARSGPHDCFQNSTPLLFARVVGGESFGVIDQSGTWRQATFVPWHFEALAGGLAYLTIGVVFLAAIWAVWRSGAAQPYSLALCFSLGTLLPGEVFTYQFLPMLPLLVIVFMKALERREFGTMLILGLAQ